MVRQYFSYAELLKNGIGPYFRAYNEKRVYGRRIKFYDVKHPEIALNSKFCINCEIRKFYPEAERITIYMVSAKRAYGVSRSVVVEVYLKNEGE